MGWVKQSDSYVRLCFWFWFWFYHCLLYVPGKVLVLSSGELRASVTVPKVKHGGLLN